MLLKNVDDNRTLSNLLAPKNYVFTISFSYVFFCQKRINSATILWSKLFDCIKYVK